MTKLLKDFGRIKMEEEMLSNKQTMKMSDYRKELRQRADEWHKEEMLRQDAKRRTAKRHSDDKIHPASIMAICAGFVAMIAVVLYLGVIVDAFIGLMEI